MKLSLGCPVSAGNWICQAEESRSQCGRLGVWPELRGSASNKVSNVCSPVASALTRGATVGGSGWVKVQVPSSNSGLILSYSLLSTIFCQILAVDLIDFCYLVYQLRCFWSINVCSQWLIIKKTDYLTKQKL